MPKSACLGHMERIGPAINWNSPISGNHEDRGSVISRKSADYGDYADRGSAIAHNHGLTLKKSRNNGSLVRMLLRIGQKQGNSGTSVLKDGNSVDVNNAGWQDPNDGNSVDVNNAGWRYVMWESADGLSLLS